MSVVLPPVVEITGNISADKYFGDGSNLTGVTAEFANQTNIQRHKDYGSLEALLGGTFEEVGATYRVGTYGVDGVIQDLSANDYSAFLSIGDDGSGAPYVTPDASLAAVGGKPFALGPNSLIEDASIELARRDSTGVGRLYVARNAGSVDVTGLRTWITDKLAADEPVHLLFSMSAETIGTQYPGYVTANTVVNNISMRLEPELDGSLNPNPNAGRLRITRDNTSGSLYSNRRVDDGEQHLVRITFQNLPNNEQTVQLFIDEVLEGSVTYTSADLVIGSGPMGAAHYGGFGYATGLTIDVVQIGAGAADSSRIDYIRNYAVTSRRQIS
ncbi:MAG: hypothetical protein AAGK78_00980 [Planctomycetota bacterium]